MGRLCVKDTHPLWNHYLPGIVLESFRIDQQAAHGKTKSSNLLGGKGKKIIRVAICHADQLDHQIRIGQKELVAKL